MKPNKKPKLYIAKHNRDDKWSPLGMSPEIYVISISLPSLSKSLDIKYFSKNNSLIKVGVGDSALAKLNLFGNIEVCYEQ